MNTIYDLTGQQFGRLRVIRRAGSNKSKYATWLCECECGNTVVVVGQYLRCGDTKSCGCFQKENLHNLMSTHGFSKTRLYRVWAGIKTRCYNKNSDNYKYYGANGVKMCDEWKDNFDSFMKWSIQNGYDEKAKTQYCTIDRIDNSKDYSPDNCRWVNHFVQCNNQSSNKVFTYKGKTMTMSEWARATGINYSTLRARIRRNVPFEIAIQKISTQ